MATQQSPDRDGIQLILWAASRTASQLSDPAFVKVLVKAALLSFVGLTLLLWVIGLVWPEASIMTDWVTGLFSGDQTQVNIDIPAESADDDSSWLTEIFSWITGFLYWFVVGLAFYLLFPAFLTLIIGLFLDDITDAVEDRFYPHTKAGRQIGIVEGAAAAVALSVKLLLVHLMLLIPYIILAVFSFSIGAFLLFLAVNAWAYGREYFQMVAARHYDPRGTKAFYKQNSKSVILGGVAIALLFLVPFVNLIAPVFGVAMMTHLTHDLMDKDSFGDQV